MGNIILTEFSAVLRLHVKAAIWNWITTLNTSWKLWKEKSVPEVWGTCYCLGRDKEVIATDQILNDIFASLQEPVWGGGLETALQEYSALIHQCVLPCLYTEWSKIRQEFTSLLFHYCGVKFEIFNTKIKSASDGRIRVREIFKSRLDVPIRFQETAARIKSIYKTFI